MTAQRRVALITGANHGIGAATARDLAGRGVSVLINYLRLPPLAPDAPSSGADVPGKALYDRKRAVTADDVVRSIREKGGSVEAVEADLSDPATIPLLFDRAEAAFGPVEILINNADAAVPDTFIPQPHLGPGDVSPAGYPMRTVTAESHDAHFAVNSRAPALLMAEFTRRYLERGANWGRIVNFSTDGAAGFAGEVSYGASKYALESYSRAAAVELGPHGITVNIVSPGPIQTGYITPEAERRIAAETPLGRVGEVEDVADVVVFLVSDQARWLTGQILYVGGGHRMR
jgi:3-oxoacyl-[acyl-carrier protein] reductase